MAKKAFEIQSSDLVIGGVNLQAGTDRIVIPGVTQATTYKVDEVDEVDEVEQTQQFTNTITVIDYITYQEILNNTGNGSTRADYITELDDDNYIDEIEVGGSGSYTTQESNRNGDEDLYAYKGTGSASDRPIVPEDWARIPFRPKMRAGAIQTIGGGSGGVVERSIEFPEGEEGDTAGTLALTPSGDLYICTTDWVDYSDAGGAYGGFETSENFLPGQTGFVSNSVTILLADVPSELLYILQNVAIVPSDWSVIMDDEEFGGEQTCTNVGFNVGGNPSFSWPYRNGTDPNGIPAGSGFTVAYSGEVPQPAIWEQVALGNPLGDLSVENGEIINDDGDITLNADSDVLIEAGDDIRLDADDEVSIRTYGTGSGNYVEVVTGYDSNDQHQWKFDTDGNLTLPEGGDILDSEGNSVLGSSTTISKFVMVNDNGNVWGSDDGENWTGPFDTGINDLNKVAVGPNMVVYLGSPDDQGEPGNGSTNVYYATDWNMTPTLVDDELPSEWFQVRYFDSIERFVTVGSWDGTPAYKHSADGITWTVVLLDNTWAETLDGGDGYGSAGFQDIATNGTGFLLITNNTVLGSFYTTTLTTNTNIGLNDWLDDNMEFERVLYSAQSDFTGWFAFGPGDDNADDDAWWYNGSFNPGNGSFSNNWGISDIGQEFQEVFNYEPTVSEIAIGRYNSLDTIVIGTSNGQILYWPAVEDGPFVTIPKPYTNTTFTITNANPAVVTWNGEEPAANGEKIVITGAGDFNGTYYVGSGDVLYTNTAMTTALDSSGFTAFASGGTITFSHGMYIDALNYANGKFYVANDNEEVFVSSNGGATWTEVASLTGPGGEGEGQGWMTDIDGYVREGTGGNANTVSYAPDDTDNWEDATINTVQAALDELAARVTALQNFEVDGGNAYTPALGEQLIDGNGA
jgi:hypothetical protein